MCPANARATVLVLAGLDPSGGAGLAADIQAVASQGAHALPVATALTAQDNERVFEVQAVAPAFVLRQARALTARIRVDAIKIGIPGSRANAEAIAELVMELRRDAPRLPVVLDPVLASGHGDLLSVDDAVAALAVLLPLTTVLLPNGPEAGRLCGAPDAPAETQGRLLRERGCRHVLLTGGHADGPFVVNRWFGPDEQHDWRWPRLPGAFHGSGCTLAGAVAARLAQGEPMALALAGAQAYCHQALAAAYPIAPGQLMPRR